MVGVGTRVTYLGEDVAVGGALMVDVAVFAVLLSEPQVLHALAFLASTAGTGSDVRTTWREQHRAGRRGYVLSATAHLEGTRGVREVQQHWAVAKRRVRVPHRQSSARLPGQTGRRRPRVGPRVGDCHVVPEPVQQCEPFQEGATLDQGEVKKPSSLI